MTLKEVLTGLFAVLAITAIGCGMVYFVIHIL